MRRQLISVLWLTLAVSTLAATAHATQPTSVHKCTQSTSNQFIVQAASGRSAAKAVTAVGGLVCRPLDVVNGVAASLSQQQAEALAREPNVRVTPDTVVTTRRLLVDQTSLTFIDGLALTLRAKELLPNYRMLIGSDALTSAGVTGKGVTIAVLDSGFWADAKDGIKGRTLASYDAINGTTKVESDPFGHGTHVTSIAAGTFGIAPQANLVIVRAFDKFGGGSYSNVIAGLEWIIANRVKYKIRVLNLSFGAVPQSNYWEDPLNQAVMKAWRAGIVVVAAAGNEGPLPMTIGVPGNVPYVITVGAQTDNYTPFNPFDDQLASFSSTGPTYEGFVKPEVVAPGGHIVGSMWYQSYLGTLDPRSMSKDTALFTMSGTSQAAASTSGVVALMLQSQPSLTPDEVKCRLMASASPAITWTGKLAYSVFQQGAGFVNALAANSSGASRCANVGLNIDADLNGAEHFGGPANRDPAGNYYVMNMDGERWGEAVNADGYSWSKGYSWDAGFMWSSGYSWSKGFSWSKGYSWSQGYSWSKGFSWSKGYSWSKTLPWWGTTSPVIQSPTRPASIASWVPNE